MIDKTVNARSLSIALSSATFLVSALMFGHAGAQTKPPAAAAVLAAPALPAEPAAAKPAPVKSAFEGYQAYSDDKMISWKAANDEVALIGGWREYAKQAQQPEGDPASKTGESKPQPKP